MKLIGCTSYDKLLYLMCSGPLLEKAVGSLKFAAPNFGGEGIVGAILVNYEIEVKDLHILANIFDAYHSLSNKRRLYLDGLSRGLGDCK